MAPPRDRLDKVQVEFTHLERKLQEEDAFAPGFEKTAAKLKARLEDKLFPELAAAAHIVEENPRLHNAAVEAQSAVKILESLVDLLTKVMSEAPSDAKYLLASMLNSLQMIEKAGCKIDKASFNHHIFEAVAWQLFLARDYATLVSFTNAVPTMLSWDWGDRRFPESAPASKEYHQKQQ